MRRVMVSVADKDVADLSQLVEDLRNAGLVVDEVLPAIGTVTGSIAPAAIATLEAVPGVLHVETQRDYHLPSTEPTDPDNRTS
jgi:hypothetical protein